MKRIRLKWFAILSGLSVFLGTGPAQAVTFTEGNDAGERLEDAISVFSEQTSPLDSISGVLSGDADLFQIFLTGGQQFSATTLNPDTLLGIPIDNTLGNPNDLLGDPQLFLFDALGNGIYANDDSFGSSQATLPSLGFSPVESGIYFLGISGFDVDPISAGGEIFPDQPANAAVGPTGSGGGAPLIGFAGQSSSSGRYTISLTGAQTIAAPASVPEPAALLGLLAVGALGLASQTTKTIQKS
ncbi:MAG: hypothetical protein AAFX95_22190 [Cyanobacteria bacterium J06639_16]